MKIANIEYLQHGGLSTLRTALLERLPDLLASLTITRVRRAPSPDGPSGHLLVQIRTPSRRTHTLRVEVRASSAPSRIPQVLRQLTARGPRRAVAYPVLASSFLSPRARELCREGGVGYLDLAGNCYLQFDDFHLQKIVERNPFPARGRPASLFSPVSSRILRVLLEEPARAWRITELATTARASLGQTSNVCRRLADEAYAARVERSVRLTQPGQLLDAWRQAYTIRQHPQAAYYSFEREPDQLMRRVAAVAAERRWRYAVTSFAAARLVAPFVHGVGTVQWYLGEDATATQWAEALDLRPVESGPNAVLRIPHDAGVLHRTQLVDGIALVGNVQLYLDLASEPGRGLEQADFLRRQKLQY